MFGGNVSHLTSDQQGAVNVIAAAIVGVVLTALAKRDELPAALYASAKAIIAAIVAFGAKLKPE